MGDALPRILSTAGVFGVTVLAIYALATVASAPSGASTRRLRKYLTAPVIHPDAKAASRSQMGSQVKGILGIVGRVLEIKRLSKDLELELLRADVPFRGHEFLGGVAILAIGGSFLVSLASGNVVHAAAAGAIGAFGPLVALSVRKKRRLAAFNDQIGNALAVMSNSLRAGYSFMQGMDLIARELPPPLSVEFGRAIREIGLGASVETALANMMRRVPSPDFDLVVTAVLIQRQVGGNLAEISDKIAQTIADRMKIQGSIRTLTSQGKLSGLVLSLLPFVLGAFLFLTNRSYMTPLVTTLVGKILIGVAILGEVLGAMAIAKIVKIEV